MNLNKHTYDIIQDDSEELLNFTMRNQYFLALFFTWPHLYMSKVMDSIILNTYYFLTTRFAELKRVHKRQISCSHFSLVP